MIAAHLKRAFRIGTLVVPSWLAWFVAFTYPRSSHVADVMAKALMPVWILIVAAIVLRILGLAFSKREAPGGLLAQVDILTGAGSALSWTSALSIMGAVWMGWASLAYVGLLGSGLFHVVVVLAMIALRSGDPTRSGSITRRFTPSMPSEGESVVEELRFENVHIPAGFRMFVTGRVAKRWATTRHVLEAATSGGEVSLESEIGPAVRGDFEIEPTTIWLEDTFGLTRSAPVLVGRGRLTVVPRTTVAEHATPLLSRGIGASEPRPTGVLPTEGAFDLREYKPGDDVRRIHWVRSLAARELVVRLPDELPPNRPRVRLVLDTHFPEQLSSGDAAAELLDALIDTWLAAGRALLRTGARVTLVVPMGREDAASAAVIRQELTMRSETEALRLGASIAWQSQTRVEEILTDEETFIVSRSVLFVPPPKTKARWIVVVPTLTEPPWPSHSAARMRHPMGSSDNRWLRVRRDEKRREQARRDYAESVLAMRTIVAAPPAGSFLVRSANKGEIVLEALR